MSKDNHDKKFSINIEIDVKNATLEELKEEEARLHEVADYYSGLEQATKLFLNIVYGGTANPGFQCFNINVAESITLQAQQLTRFASMCINKYFNEEIKKDIDLLNKCGIDVDKAQGYTIGFNNKRKDDLGLITLERYSDTDSVYSTLGNFIEYLDIPKENAIKVLLTIGQEGLVPYINNRFDDYAEHFHCLENTQNLELEKISHSVQMHAKKKYIMDYAWEEPNIFHEPLDKLVTVGIETNQSSTSVFARNCILDFIHTAFGAYYENSVTMDLFINKLKEYRKNITFQHPDDIIESVRINAYHKFILDDMNSVVFASGTPYHVKGAAHYNYLVNNNDKFAMRYDRINEGEIIKCYYCNIGTNNPLFGTGIETFSYIQGNYPGELAPQIDYDVTFDKQILTPVNRIIEHLRETFNMTEFEMKHSKKEITMGMLNAIRLF